MNKTTANYHTLIANMRGLIDKIEEAIANDELEAAYSQLDQVEFSSSVLRRYVDLMYEDKEGSHE